MYIADGYILLSRTILDHQLFFAKPVWWFKVWLYILLKVNYTDTPSLKRGQGLFTRKQIYEDCNLAQVRNNDGLPINPNTISGFLCWARNKKLITTQQHTRKLLITVINYDKYQNMKNYSTYPLNTPSATHDHTPHPPVPNVTTSCIPICNISAPTLPSNHEPTPQPTCSHTYNKKNKEEIKKKREGNTKTLYGDYVLLTGKEYKTLKHTLGKNVTDGLIDDLNNYIGSTGRVYKSHYHTILRWAKKDGRTQTNNQNRQPHSESMTLDKLKSAIQSTAEPIGLADLIDQTDPRYHAYIYREIEHCHGKPVLVKVKKVCDKHKNDLETFINNHPLIKKITSN